MDSKEGIEKVTPVNARAAGLLDPSLLWSGMDDAMMADLPRERAGSPVRSPTSPDETPRRESYCLYIRVLRDSDVVLEQDRKCQITAGMPALAKTFVKPRLEYCQVPSLWIC